MDRVRGRPIGSSIRQNIIEILFVKGKSYGYDIYKYYVDIFPKVTLRVIYYHLRKGVALKELELENVKIEQGAYSWGSQAEKKYYKLGPNAKPKMDKKVKDYFDNKKKR